MSDSTGADSTGLGKPSAARSSRPSDRGGDHFSAPLGSARSGRLRFTGGAHRLLVRADPRERGLFRARFGGRLPMVGFRDGVVTVRYPGTPTDGWPDRRSGRPAEVALNTTIPWDVEIRGGASRIAADLRGLRLGSLEVSGGASHLELVLPVPVGTVAVVVDGGASNAAARGGRRHVPRVWRQACRRGGGGAGPARSGIRRRGGPLRPVREGRRQRVDHRVERTTEGGGGFRPVRESGMAARRTPRARRVGGPRSGYGAAGRRASRRPSTATDDTRRRTVKEESVADIRPVFGTPADPGLLGPDGVHPSLVGK
jgi:hypothetical protein